VPCTWSSSRRWQRCLSPLVATNPTKKNPRRVKHSCLESKPPSGLTGVVLARHEMPVVLPSLLCCQALDISDAANAHGISTELKFGCRQWLGQNVCYHLGRRDVFERDVPSHHSFTGEVVDDVDVLGAHREDWVLQELACQNAFPKKGSLIALWLSAFMLVVPLSSPISNSRVRSQRASLMA
jgi:hypothetical protein